MESFPTIQYVAAQSRSSRVTVQIGRNTREFHRKNHIYVDVQRHFLWVKDNEKESLANTKLVSLNAKRFGKGQWSFIVPGSEKKWCCISEDSPQGVWDNMAEKMLLEFAESGCPIFHATSPLSRCQFKSYAADQETIETIFRIIVSASQLSSRSTC